MSTAEPRPHRLAERVKSSRLLLQVLCAAANQVKTGIRGIYADKEKLTTQSKIDRKRNRPELIDLPEKAPRQSVSKLFNNSLN